MAKKPVENLIQNRRALHDYQIHDEYNVGIVLNGREVKAVRSGHVQLKGSYVTIKNNEIWLINASFSVVNTAPGESKTTVDTSDRKLLASRKEINELITAKTNGLTIVPLSMTTKTPFIKVKIATAKGKKMHDKRHAIKARDIEREQKRTMLK